MQIINRKKPVALALALLGLGTLALPAQADFIRSVSFPKDATAGSDNRYYSLYIPSGYNASQKTPLVVTLHGCRQSDLEMVDKGNMHIEAERDNFIVLYPFQNSSTNPTVGGVNDDDGRNPNCWGYWLDAERKRGAGEVYDIKRMVDKIKTQYNIDPDRVHITGISSGGGMANIAQVAYPDVFASAVIVEGIAYKETAATYTGTQSCPLILNGTVDATNRAASAIITDMRTEMNKSVLRQAPVMVIHNKKDCTVPISVGKNVAATWAGLRGAEGKAINLNSPTSVVNSPAGEFKWTHSKYGTLPNGDSLLETFYLDVSEADVVGAGVVALSTDPYAPSSDSAVAEDTKKGHWWSGGLRAPWIINAGPNTSALAWKFFKTHPKCTDTACPSTGPTDAAPTMTSCSVSGITATSATINGAATDNGTVSSYKVVLSGPTATTDASAGSGASFSKQYVGLSNGYYTATVTATDNLGQVSIACNVAQFLVGTAPAILAPTGLAAGTTTATTVPLTWSAVSGATGYNVYRGTTKVTASPVTTTSYTDTGLTASTSYSYTVTAVNSSSESVKSAAVNATTQAAVPYSQAVTSTVLTHYTSGRINVTQYNTLGAKYGYSATITLYKCGTTWTNSATCGPLG